MSDVDQIIQCPVCGQWRHNTWFDVGARGCKQCQADEEVSFAFARARVQIELDEIPDTMLEIVQGETKPDGITSSQWRILHLLRQGYDDTGIALATSIPAQDIPNLKKIAMTALYHEADRRADINLGIDDATPPSPPAPSS